jgi:diacylglycerol kinase family enzyme
MLAQPLRTTNLRLLRSPQAPVAEPKVAVLLNTNARKVTQKVIRSLSHVVAEEDLFLSRSQMDARRIAQMVIDRRYHTVFCGGGDGTFMGFANEIIKQAQLRGRGRTSLPRFGVLKLGTGNGLASLVHASGLAGEGILDDVLRARANEVPSTRRLDLLQVDGKRAQFAGLGLDAKLLNDYISLKETLGRGPMKRLASGPMGYLASISLKTVPHYLTHSTFRECEVINGAKGKAFRLGAHGEVIQEFAPGELLFRGRLMMAAASTIPYYGYEFTMFPFAGTRRGHMQLRLAALSTPTVLVNLPRLWKGRWFHEGIHDFFTQEATVRFREPMPFQIGGDAAGYREQVHFKMAPEQIELLDFTGAVG